MALGKIPEPSNLQSTMLISSTAGDVHTRLIIWPESVSARQTSRIPSLGCSENIYDSRRSRSASSSRKWHPLLALTIALSALPLWLPFCPALDRRQELCPSPTKLTTAPLAVSTPPIAHANSFVPAVISNATISPNMGMILEKISTIKILMNNCPSAASATAALAPVIPTDAPPMRLQRPVVMPPQKRRWPGR